MASACRLGAAGLTILAAKSAVADTTASRETASGAALQALTKKLDAIPRRCDFKTVLMILTTNDLWDSEALNAVIHYKGTRKQVWDNTDINGPWLNLMRNALNAQVWSWKHPDFLAVSATHSLAHPPLMKAGAARLKRHAIRGRFSRRGSMARTMTPSTKVSTSACRKLTTWRISTAA